MAFEESVYVFCFKIGLMSAEQECEVSPSPESMP